MSQQTWEFLASRTKWTLRGFPECCFSPPRSELRSLSTGRGSEETAQRHCKQHVQSGGGVNKTSPHWGNWIWNWMWQVRKQQGTCVTTPQPWAGAFSLQGTLAGPRVSHRVLEALLPKQTRDDVQHVKQRAKRYTKSLRTGGLYQEKLRTSCPAPPVGPPSQTKLLCSFYHGGGSCMTGLE